MEKKQAALQNISYWLASECNAAISQSGCDEKTKTLATKMGQAVVSAFSYFAHEITDE